MRIEAMKLIRDAIEQGVDLGAIGAKHILDQAIAEAEKQEPVAIGAWQVYGKNGDLLYTLPKAEQEPTPDGLRDAEAELNCAEDVLDALSVKYFTGDEGSNGFDCIGDYITAIVKAIEEQPKREPLTDDAKRLDALRDNSWDLRCFDIPTGGDDADIGWRVIEHHMSKPQERVVAEFYGDDPRRAIDCAIEAAHGIKE